MSPSAKEFRELHEIYAPLMLGHTCKMKSGQHEYYLSNKGNQVIGMSPGIISMVS